MIWMFHAISLGRLTSETVSFRSQLGATSYLRQLMVGLACFRLQAAVTVCYRLRMPAFPRSTSEGGRSVCRRRGTSDGYRPRKGTLWF